MKKAFLLALDDEWRIVRVNGGATEARHVCGDDDNAPAALKAVLHGWSWRGQSVCLGLPSRMIFAAQIETDNLPRKQRRQAMLYRLEEQLPMDVEALVVDFLPPVSGRALGVAANTQDVKTLLDRLAESGIEVSAIGSTALMALWSACQSREDSDYVVIAGGGGHYDLFRMQQRMVVSWLTADSAEDLGRSIRADQLSRPVASKPATVRVVGEAPEILPLLQEDLGLRLLPAGGSALAEAGKAAARMLAGQDAGWIDLRQGQLARQATLLSGPARTTAVLAVCLLAALTGAFYYRGMQYEAAARRAFGGQVDLVSRLQPGEPRTRDPLRRLQSELTRLQGIRGSAQNIPARVNVLDVLRVLSRNLPQVRLRINELRVDQNTILIEGHVREHGHAEAVQRALIEGGLNMDPPRTERLAPPDEGVSFTLTGQVNPSEILALRSKQTPPATAPAGDLLEPPDQGEMDDPAAGLPAIPEEMLEGLPDDLRRQLEEEMRRLPPPDLPPLPTPPTAPLPATRPSTGPGRRPGDPARTRSLGRGVLLERRPAAPTPPAEGEQPPEEVPVPPPMPPDAGPDEPDGFDDMGEPGGFVPAPPGRRGPAVPDDGGSLPDNAQPPPPPDNGGTPNGNDGASPPPADVNDDPQGEMIPPRQDPAAPADQLDPYEPDVSPRDPTPQRPPQMEETTR